MKKMYSLKRFKNSSFIVGVLVNVFACILFSCNNGANKSKQKALNQSPSNITIPVITTKQAAPKIVNSDTCPPPVRKVITPSKQTAQTKTPVQGKSFFTTYTTDNGLILDAIASSLVDSKGNIWLGTNGGGVSCFNGHSFINYSSLHGLVSNEIRCMYEDKNGTIWFCTDGGISLYDGKSFSTFSGAKDIIDNSVICITADEKNNIWFGTNFYGVYCFDGKSTINLTTKNGLLDNQVTCIIPDKKGNIWFGSSQGLSFYNGKTITNYNGKIGLANNQINCGILDNKGDLWVGTQGGGIGVWTGKSFVSFTSKEGLAGNDIVSIMQDHSGIIWVGTDGNGVSYFKPEINNQNVFTNFSTKQGLTNDKIASIVEDKSNNIWFGTNGGGVNGYEGTAFTSYTKDFGMPDNVVWGITEDRKGTLWLGVENKGVCSFDGYTFNLYDNKKGLLSNNISGILTDSKGLLWFGTTGGVSRFDGKEFLNYRTKQGLVYNYVNCIVEDDSKNIWFGTGEGISCFDGKNFKNFTTKEGLINNSVFSILDDGHGKIWIGNDKSGVSCYDGKSFSNFRILEGPENNFISCIAKDKKGNIWFGIFGGGVSRYDGKSFINYNLCDGLPNNDVTQLIIDDENVLIGTNDGIALIKDFVNLSENQKIIDVQNNLSNNELLNYKPQFEVYNSSTGYPIKDVNVGQKTMFKDSKGNIWIATGADKTGLVRFNPSALKQKYSPPSIAISSIKINNDNICWYNLDTKKYNSTSSSDSLIDKSLSSPAKIEEIQVFNRPLKEEEKNAMRLNYGNLQFDSISRWFPIPQQLVLPYEHNNITFDFLAIETHRNALIKFQYKLEGYDHDWSAISNQTTASFGNIAEGNYTFKLKARNASGIWSQPITYSFKVLPPWYRSWWAYILYLSLTIVTLYIIYYWRTSKLRYDKELLEKTVKERTLELENKNGEIEKQKKIIEQKNEKITDSINYAKHIQDSLLKNESDIQKHLPEMFTYYRPKDIVSGDFYWFSKVFDKLVIAVADCTGHGVPGAFMSMIGNILLNEIVNDLYFVEPGKILDELHKRIFDSLHQDIVIDGSQDGMDISVCVIDTTNQTLSFAGAQNPLYIIKNNTLEVIKADNLSIGGKSPRKEKDPNLKFETHLFPIEKNMKIYMFSDGYIDQFGGSDRKKLGSVQFKELLTTIADLPMSEQKKIIHQKFEDWKGTTPQIDDVLVVGVSL